MTALAALLRTALAIVLLLAAPARWCQDPVPVRIIAINDFHGHLEPGDNAVEVPDPARPGQDHAPAQRRRGVPRDAASGSCAPSSRTASSSPSGDLIGASPLISGLFLDEPTIEVMNAIGIDLNAVGNHEFDRGARELLRIVGGGCRSDAVGDSVSCASAQPHLCRRSLPVHRRERASTATVKPLFAPTVVRSVDGVTVGFIGAVTRTTPGIVQPAGIAGLRFLGEAQAINAARRAAAHARRAGDRRRHPRRRRCRRRLQRL